MLLQSFSEKYILYFKNLKTAFAKYCEAELTSKTVSYIDLNQVAYDRLNLKCNGLRLSYKSVTLYLKKTI